MRVPIILYHGTTMLRWGFIKRNGLLRCDMSKSFKVEEALARNTGYVFLSSDLEEASMYGLIKSVLDTTYLDIPDNMKLNPNYRDPVVLGINGFKLKDNLEIDPEVNTPYAQEIRNIKNGISQWYRYKGNIKLKHVLTSKKIPFDTFNSNLINELLDKLPEVNETKLQKSQLIMKRL